MYFSEVLWKVRILGLRKFFIQKKNKFLKLFSQNKVSVFKRKTIFTILNTSG